jgi:hypothetical protein
MHQTLWKTLEIIQVSIRYRPNTKPMDDLYTCLHCGKSITRGLGEFSIHVYGVALCLKDQVLLIESTASQEAKDLFLALRFNKIPAELEYHDGQKTVDIAIPGKLYIEVDQRHPSEDIPSLGDLLNSQNSSELDAIPTIKIPHSVVNSPNLFRKTVDGLTTMYSNLGKVG